jgi:hypothetical protein
MTMKLKLDENGNAVLQDGKPVYVHDDGKEVPFDAAQTVATIARLNGEAKGHRERAEKAESTLKNYEGIEDPKLAIEALKTVSNLDAKKLVDAGEIERVKAEAIKAVEDKYAPVVKERDTFRDSLYQEKVGGSFARSQLISEKLAIPADLVQARFGGAFKVEDGNVVAFGQDGNKIYSRARPGEVATFDEALEFLIDQYPYKDSILKGTGAAGTGSKGSGGAATGQKQLNREQFGSLSPSEQMSFVKGGGSLTD